MSEVVPGAPVPEYSGNSVDNAPSGGAPTSSTPNGDASSNAAAQRPALSPESTAAIAAAKKRRRGRRGGRNRNRTSASGTRTQAANSNMAHNDSVQDDENDTDDLGGENETLTTVRVQQPPRVQRQPLELPDPPTEGRMMSAEVAGEALVRKPQIGDTRPAPPSAQSTSPAVQAAKQSKRGAQQSDNADKSSESGERNKSRRGGKRGGRNRRGRSNRTDDRDTTPGTDAELMERRKGKERNGKAVGRYLMCVQVRPDFTQVAMLEGRSLIEHYVSRPADDDSQIHGNIYLGRVQNVLPGMEAAFVDIGTPKNAVLYRGDVQLDKIN